MLDKDNDNINNNGVRQTIYGVINISGDGSDLGHVGFAGSFNIIYDLICDTFKDKLSKYEKMELKNAIDNGMWRFSSFIWYEITVEENDTLHCITSESNADCVSDESCYYINMDLESYKEFILESHDFFINNETQTEYGVQFKDISDIKDSIEFLIGDEDEYWLRVDCTKINIPKLDKDEYVIYS